MRLFSVKSGFILLCLLPELACIRSEFYICDAQSLRVTEAFEASRLAATLFPCIVSDVLLKYKLPTSMLLSGYKPFCFITRVCFAMISTNRITNRRDFDIVTNCGINSFGTLAELRIFEYYKVSANARRDFDNGKLVRSFFSRIFGCFDKHGVENFRIGPNTAIAMIRFVMDELF